MYGTDCLKPFPKMMISEDFAYYMEKVPGVFGLIGSQNKSLGITAKNHNDHYTVDESVLKREPPCMHSSPMIFWKEAQNNYYMQRSRAV